MELSPGGSPKDPQERPRTPQGTPKELPRDPQAAPRIPEGHPRAKGHAKISKGSPNRTRLMIGFGSRACRARVFFLVLAMSLNIVHMSQSGVGPQRSMCLCRDRLQVTFGLNAFTFGARRRPDSRCPRASANHVWLFVSDQNRFSANRIQPHDVQIGFPW